MESGFSETELRKFSEAGRVIAGAVGTSVELWARAEAGVILKAWAGSTPVATLTSVTRRSILRAYRVARDVAGFGSLVNKGSTRPGEASINLGLRHGNEGRVYYRTRKRGMMGGRSGFQDVYSAGFGRGKHIAPRDWGRVQMMVAVYRTEVKAMIAAAKRAAGLSRQSIVQIADDLGIRLENVKGGRTIFGGTLSAAGIAKARAAIASNGTRYVNGYAEVSANARSFYLTLVNRYPKIGALFMDRTLQRVILGRMQFFQKNLEKGAFLSAERAAKAYPYLQVLKSAA